MSHNDRAKTWLEPNYQLARANTQFSSSQLNWTLHSGMYSYLIIFSAYYSPNGQRLLRPQKGINIVLYEDGTTRKIVVK